MFAKRMLKGIKKANLTFSKKFSELATEQGSSIAQVTSRLAKARQKLDNVENVAFLEYKSWPEHIGHWNKDSSEYVESEREENLLSREISSFNATIDDFKNSLQLQRELYDAIETMDRPYLRGERGVQRNVYDQVQDYSKDAGHDLEYIEYQGDNTFNELFSNEHRYIRSAVYTPKLTSLSNEITWKKALEQRPVNPNFNKDKGYKFDVMVPYEERAPHVADRLGHPEFLGDPVDRLLRLENDNIHPNYLDQPFVQTPPVDYDSDVDLQEGDILFENPNILEWGSFTAYTAWFATAFAGIWAPYNMFIKSRLPSESMNSVNFMRVFDLNFYSLDNFGFLPAFLPLALYYIPNTLMQVLRRSTSCFVSKIQYNKGKDLFFITTPPKDVIYSENHAEAVHEVDHFQILPGFSRVSGQYMSINDSDGFYVLTDMKNQTVYYVNKEDRYI